MVPDSSPGRRQRRPATSTRTSTTSAAGSPTTTSSWPATARPASRPSKRGQRHGYRPCTLPPLFGGSAESVDDAVSATCTLELDWDARPRRSAARPVAYNVYRSQSSGFTPGPANLLVWATSARTTMTDIERARQRRREYYYVVRAVDCLQLVSPRREPPSRSGRTRWVRLTTGTWTDDAGDTGQAKMIPDDSVEHRRHRGQLRTQRLQDRRLRQLTCAGSEHAGAAPRRRRPSSVPLLSTRSRTAGTRARCRSRPTAARVLGACCEVNYPVNSIQFFRSACNLPNR